MAAIEGELIREGFPPKKPQELPVRMIPKKRPPPLEQPGAKVLLAAQDLAAILLNLKRRLARP